MNQSNILDMLRADPSIADDIPGFVKRMNEPTQKQVTKSRVEIVEETRQVSVAELSCGGLCTEDDVKQAIATLAQEPLLQRTQVVYEQTLAAIQSGEVTTDAEAFQKAIEVSQIDPATIVGK